MSLTFNLELEGKSSPWGRIQNAYTVADGIFLVSTAGHGGAKLDRKRNAQVPKPWRSKGGWYEEDCDWAIVALTFPEEPYFAEVVGPDDQTRVDYARSSARHYNPEFLAFIEPEG